MFELSVDAHFAAAHLLYGYRGDCGRLHGHTWKVTATVAAKGNETLGMSMDFKDIAEKLDGIIALLDHRNLNDLEWFGEKNPTAENLAVFIFDRLDAEIAGPGIALRSVTVAESERYRVTYRKDGFDA